ncbi:MAG: SH3 domain-containing protein [Bacteroidales bacterium]|nr:SH3 domain-containing protein [Bacteroidales bacterium]
MKSALINLKRLNAGRILKIMMGLMLVLLCEAAIGQEHYVVTASKAVVKKEASDESSIIGVLWKGDDVYVHAIKGSWAEIDYKKSRAFVLRKYIEKSSKPIFTNPSTSSTSPNSSLTFATTTSSNSSNTSLSSASSTSSAASESGLKPAGNNQLTAANNATNEVEKKPRQTSPVRRTQALNFALGGTLGKNKNVKFPSFYTLESESGSFFASSSVFYNLGLGLYFVDFKTSVSGYSYKSFSWGLRIPAHIGYMFGNEDKFHLALRAGVCTNFLFSQKVNKERVKVAFKDRFGFTGSFKATIGYGVFCLSAEYLLPFKSGSDGGAWMFGIAFGI